MTNKLTESVKVIDFGPFRDGSNRQGVADEILECFKSIGFVYLTNHGMPQETINRMFDWSKTLFDLPLEVKQLAPHPPGAHHRGYSAPGREQVHKRTHAGGDDVADTTAVQRNIKESFESGREDNAELPNIWYPEGVIPGFKEACLNFYWICNQMQLEIWKALALGFGLPEDYFHQFHTDSQNQLRLLHYPSIPSSVLDDKEASRIPAHSDYGSITLLLQDNIGGLEVEDPNNPGTFMPVPPVPGALLVNAGDFLMRWSNDTIKSAVHRVRAPSSTEGQEGRVIPSRYSIPYFVGPNSNMVIDCIPGTWSDQSPKKYAPISPGEYIYSRIAASYA